MVHTADLGIGWSTLLVANKPRLIAAFSVRIDPLNPLISEKSAKRAMFDVDNDQKGGNPSRVEYSNRDHAKLKIILGGVVEFVCRSLRILTRYAR